MHRFISTVAKWSGLSLVLLFAGSSSVLAIPVSTNQPSCTCMFTDECGVTETCARSCTDRSDPLDPKNGICVLLEGAGIAIAPNALNNVILAYENAGRHGGGPADPSVLAELSRMGLSEAQQQTVHHVALELMSMYIGVESVSAPFRRGYITYEPNCGEARKHRKTALGDLAPFPPSLAEMAPLIREALVAELREPGQGHLERTLERVASEAPRFLTFGRCDFPFPVADFRHPYNNGMECLAGEATAILAKLHQAEETPYEQPAD